MASSQPSRQYRVASSPHLPVKNSVQDVMLRLLLALLPGAAMQSLFFGAGVLLNLVLCVTAALLAEALLLKLRGRPLKRFLTDGSALVTGMLLGLALPAGGPWWLPVIGAFFAIVFGKHLYGGLGYNPFNPAMVGYVILLISFPIDMSAWIAHLPLFEGGDGPLWHGPISAIQAAFGGGLDGLTAATPLDHVRTQLGQSHTISEAMAGPTIGLLAGKGWDWVALAYLGGGLWLLKMRVIRWHIPAGFFAGLVSVALLFWLVDPDQFASPLFHAFAGASIFGAFFIATDPVSASTTVKGRVIYGALIGVLVWIIRTWGGYPDAIAFAVLLGNMCAPLIDHYTQPRVYGQQKDPFSLR